MFTAPFLVFIVLQGGVVFFTAWLGTRLLETSSIPGKLGLMAASYVAWTVMTWGGFYVIYGNGSGSGGLMDGFGMAILLSITALVSSIFYAVFWALISNAEKVRPNA